MDIKIICAGRLKEKYWKTAEEEYKKIINKKCRFQIIELQDESIPKKKSAAEEDRIKEKEGKSILSQTDRTDYVVALCIDGAVYDDKKLKRKVSEISDDGRYKSIAFIIGGSLGLHDSVIKRADCKISFSNMTFPHQMMRIILLDALSRCLDCNAAQTPV